MYCTGGVTVPNSPQVAGGPNEYLNSKCTELSTDHYYCSADLYTTSNGIGQQFKASGSNVIYVQAKSTGSGGGCKVTKGDLFASDISGVGDSNTAGGVTCTVLLVKGENL